MTNTEEPVKTKWPSSAKWMVGLGILIFLCSISFLIYLKYFHDDLVLKNLKNRYFTDKEMTHLRNVGEMEILGAVGPAEKMLFIRDFTVGKNSDLLLKIGSSRLNGYVLFKTDRPLLYIAYGTDCQGHYQYSLMTAAEVKSPELLLKPAVKSNTSNNDQENNPYLEKMPIFYVNDIKVARASYMFNEYKELQVVKDGSEEQMLDIALCLEGGKKALIPNQINENITPAESDSFSFSLD